MEVARVMIEGAITITETAMKLFQMEFLRIF
jgi:hypothetical protein